MLNLQLRYLLVSNFLNLFAFSLFSPLFALYAVGVGANLQVVGLSYAVSTAASAFMIFIFGRYEDRFKDKKKLIVFGYFWLAVAAYSFLLVHNIPELFVVQIFNAVGTGMLLPAWKATYSKTEHRGSEAKE